MFSSNCLRSDRVGPIAAATLVALISISISSTPARAVITDTDWSLKISERELAFRPASDMMAMKSLMWDIPSSRMAARNLPFICLTNESAAASISEFKMTIGDEQFHFANSLMGMYAKLGRETPGFAISSNVADGGNTLVVNFLNGGLAPGKTVDFQFDIDVDAAFANSFYMHPDYRTVLFDMNGDNLYQNAGIVNHESSDDNAEITLKFDMAGMPSVIVGPVAFEDPSIEDGSAGFVNNRLARYGQSDPIRAFALSGGGVVPEPSAVILGLLGLLGMTPHLARRRRTTDYFRKVA
jgi:hypothetical protein